MTVVVATEIVKRMFIWGVTVCVMAPRLPFDDYDGMNNGNDSTKRNKITFYWRMIFGRSENMTYNYRKLLFLVLILNGLRLFLGHYESNYIVKDVYYIDDAYNDDDDTDTHSDSNNYAANHDGDISNHFLMYSDMLGVIEVTCLTFIAFLLPYQLVMSLRRIINVPPMGNILTHWLLLATVLSALGVLLSRYIIQEPGFWCLKKFANVVSTFPILSSLSLYNSTTNPQTKRGNIMAQTLQISEYVFFTWQMSSAIGYAFFDTTMTENSAQMKEILVAFQSISFIADWTRVLIHGVYLNYIDEMSFLYYNDNADRRQSSEQQGEHVSRNEGRTMEENQSKNLPTVASTRGKKFLHGN